MFKKKKKHLSPMTKMTKYGFHPNLSSLTNTQTLRLLYSVLDTYSGWYDLSLR